MHGWRGFAMGGIGLALLYVLVANRAATQHATGILYGAGTLTRKFLSPAVPAFGKVTQGVGTIDPASAGAGAYAAINQLPPATPTTPSGNPLPPTRIPGAL